MKAFYSHQQKICPKLLCNGRAGPVSLKSAKIVCKGVFCSHEKRLTILLLLSTSSCFPKQPLNPHCSFPIFQI